MAVAAYIACFEHEGASRPLPKLYFVRPGKFTWVRDVLNDIKNGLRLTLAGDSTLTLLYACADRFFSTPMNNTAYCTRSGENAGSHQAAAQ